MHADPNACYPRETLFAGLRLMLSPSYHKRHTQDHSLPRLEMVKEPRFPQKPRKAGWDMLSERPKPPLLDVEQERPYHGFSIAAARARRAACGRLKGEVRGTGSQTL